MTRMAKRPAAGYVRNPLAALPPNMLCPCKSGLKFKKCCAPLTPYAIPRELEDAWQRAKDKALDGGQAW